MKSQIVKAFPPKNCFYVFLIKMATNELICHFIEVIKILILTVLWAI